MERPIGIEPTLKPWAKLAVNFKNAENGGFFNVLEFLQMENGKRSRPIQRMLSHATTDFLKADLPAWFSHGSIGSTSGLLVIQPESDPDCRGMGAIARFH